MAEPEVCPSRPETPQAALGVIEPLLRGRRWLEIASLGPWVSGPLETSWLPVADHVAFALSQLDRWDESAGLWQKAYAVEPTHRRASAVAYQYYDALLSRHGAGGRDVEGDRRAFTRWIREALRLHPDSIKDLYRLGIYEAQIQSRHDAAALRAFARAIRAFRRLPASTRASRGDLAKTYHKALYAGARSATRLHRIEEARHLIFSCIREDADSNHVEPAHKYFLAGRVCMALGRYDDADRALRLALDADGPPKRDHVVAALAENARARGDLAAGISWIERKLPSHRRPAYVWRLLGDLYRDAERIDDARVAYEHALRRDRGGRHLTLNRIGYLELGAQRGAQARKAFERALQFRIKKYSSDDEAALRGIIQAATLMNDEESQRSYQSRLQSLLARRGDPQGEPEEPWPSLH